MRKAFLSAQPANVRQAIDHPSREASSMRDAHITTAATRALIIALALAPPSTAFAVSHQLPCWLNAAQVVPPSSSSPARASATITLNDETGAYTIQGTHNVANVSGGHLHLAPPGVNGAVIGTLTFQPGTFDGSGTLSAANVAAMLAGNTYLDIHSAAFPAGEIRGQINPEVYEFHFDLEGAQQVPPNASPGSGTCTIILHEITGVVIVDGAYRGLLGTVVGAWVHHAPAGAIGPPFLFPTDSGGTSGTFSATDWLAPEHVKAMLAGNTYVNVRTTVFPPGEIRGQVVEPAPCPADVDGNGAVDVDDLIAVILGWGCTNPPGPCPADVSGSGVVDVDDLIAVILGWGACS
jgi:hypothetical protein